MKLRIFVFLLALLSILFLFGCGEDPKNTSAPPNPNTGWSVSNVTGGVRLQADFSNWPTATRIRFYIGKNRISFEETDSKNGIVDVIYPYVVSGEQIEYYFRIYEGTTQYQSERYNIMPMGGSGKVVTYSTNDIINFQTSPMSFSIKNVTFNDLTGVNHNINWANWYQINWGINTQMKYGDESFSISKSIGENVTKNDIGDFEDTIIGSYVYLNSDYHFLWTTGNYENIKCFYGFNIDSKPFLIGPEFANIPFDNSSFQGTWTRNSTGETRKYIISGYGYTAYLNDTEDAKGIYMIYQNGTIRFTMTNDWYNNQWISLEDALSQWPLENVKTAFFQYNKDSIPYALSGQNMIIGGNTYTKTE
jgi:hypothetical protein